MNEDDEQRMKIINSDWMKIINSHWIENMDSDWTKSEFMRVNLFGRRVSAWRGPKINEEARHWLVLFRGMTSMVEANQTHTEK